jgi:hypothetical protein
MPNNNSKSIKFSLSLDSEGIDLDIKQDGISASQLPKQCGKHCGKQRYESPKVRQGSRPKKNTAKQAVEGGDYGKNQ